MKGLRGDDAQVAALTEKLKARTGKSIKLKTSVDPDILGGLVVKMGSRMIDASLKTKLNGLPRLNSGIPAQVFCGVRIATGERCIPQIGNF